MKGLILSGGKGTRLRPLTHTRAKQLLPVANRPILFYGIETLVDAGIKDIGIVIGDTGDEIRAAVGDGKAWGIKLTYIEQNSPLGLAHAVKIAKDFIGREPFVMYLGDNLIWGGLRQFIQEFQKTQANSLILLSPVEEPQNFGVAQLEKGKIVRLIEKPKDPPSNLALVGVYIFDQNIFEAVNRIIPSWRNELEITDAIQWLVANGYNVKPYSITNWWKDTGKAEDILEANRMILDEIKTDIAAGIQNHNSQLVGRVVVEEGVELTNSIIRGPAIIGAGSIIVNSCVGPYTSISRGVTIVNTEIEFSIIMEDCRIIDFPSRIRNSLVGGNTTLCRSTSRCKDINLILGDNSQLFI
ncbi:MAG: glucose-1-phosphate thymidylyltransferase [Clostridia bacterium]|nr:glucose-1-phosphate thymidylyltransferase [Clostridia bacterium]